MKRNNLNTRKGFTLVEMLGVLAIIAILISVISVGVLSAINRARTISTISNFKNLETALLSYVALSESSGKIPLTKSPTATAVVSASTMDDTAVLGSATQTAAALETVFMSAGTLERLPNWRVGTDGVQSGEIKMQDIAGWNRRRSGFCMTLNNNVGTIGTLANFTNVVRTECAPVDTTVVPGTYVAANNAMSGANGMNFRLDGVSNLPAGRVAYVVIPGLTVKDAEKISEEVNGSFNLIDTKQASAAATRTQTAGRFVVDAVDATVAAQGGTVTAYYYLANL